MILTGDIGKLRVMYHEVATLSKWSLTRDEGVLSNAASQMLTATVVSRDYFWIMQPVEFILGLYMGDAWWIWPANIEGLLGHSIELSVKGDPKAVSSFSKGA